jgi:hypothetical protein
MAGEFVRTPKAGDLVKAGQRYHARADLPMTELVLSAYSLVSVLASLHTGHWFAMPFAMLFTFGYGYVALLVATEQAARRRAALAAYEAGMMPASLESVPPPAASQEELAA